MDRAALDRHRHAKDEFFGRDPDSPLRAEDRAGFKGLEYFDLEPGLRLELAIIESDGSPIVVPTSDGRERIYHRAGSVEFELDGRSHALTLFDTGNAGLFVPFRDATSGDETYGGGRYIDVEPQGSMVTLDFNLAYNPYCAYSEGYSCPIPPAENHLSVRIEAGERLYTPPT